MSDDLSKRVVSCATENITNNLMAAAITGANFARETVMAAIREGHPLIPEEIYAFANETASVKAMCAAQPLIREYARVYADAYGAAFREALEPHIAAMEDVIESLKPQSPPRPRRRARKHR
jgi:hypothetical protein